MDIKTTGINSYYGPDAYDSTKIDHLTPIDNEGFSWTTRYYRSNPLPRITRMDCMEYLSYDDPRVIEYLNSTDPEVKKELDGPGHEMQYWETFRNPRAVVEVFTKLMLIFMTTTWIGGLLFGIYAAIKSPDIIPFLVFLMLLPVGLYYTGKLILRYDLVKDKNNICLNRRKGVIIIPKKKQPPKQIPFEEFDGYLGNSVNPSCSTSYHLFLEHRYSPERACSVTDTPDAWEIHQEWEFWQRFMDISQPLPDTPRFEPFRSRDPVTAAYDKARNRPPDYWKNMDIEKARAMHEASLKAAKTYPWGLTREQALAQGWQPSGLGEGGWRSEQEEVPQLLVAKGA